MDRLTRASDTEGSILDAAIDIFIANGFETTSMDAIAEAAGVAKGTLYYHFASKEGIVDAIVARYAEEGEARLAAVSAGALPFADKILAASAVLSELNGRHFRRLHRMKYIDIHAKTGSVMVNRFSQHLAHIVEQGIAEGACSTPYPLETVEVLMAATSVLLDPESGRRDVDRRRSGLSALASDALGIDGSIAERMFIDEDEA